MLRQIQVLAYLVTLVESAKEHVHLIEEQRPAYFVSHVMSGSIQSVSGISDPVFSALSRSDIPWECCNCGQPNLSSGLFDSDLFDGSLDSSSSSSSSHSRSTCSSPQAMSSPKPTSNRHNTFQSLRLLEINFQKSFL